MKNTLKKRSRLFFISWAAGIGLFIAGASYSLVLSGESPYEKIRILIDILDQVQTNYVETVELKDLVYGAARGIVQTLDPFSQFLLPEALKDMKIETEGEFGGIGIKVMIGEDGWLTVITPLPGTPAFKAGVFPRDRIVKIDGKSTEKLTIEKAVQQLRGKPGTKVVITVSRQEKAADETVKEAIKDFTLAREVIKIQTIYSRILADNIGYTRITEFNAKTPQDIHEMLGKLASQGMQSLILDLRYDPGGLLPSAIETAKEFIGEEKIIVYTQGRKAESRVEYRAAARAPYADLPLVVLINEGSASGSEILAGALQDHKRAVLVGSRTFGKASVQSVINLADGSGLRLTTAYYYTPNGRLIHKKEFKRKSSDELDVESEKAAEKAEPQIPEPAVPVVKPAPPSVKAPESKEPPSAQEADKENKKEADWGIVPDIEVEIDRETTAKVYQSFDLAYFPDKPSETKPIREIFKKTSKEGAKKDEKEEAKPEKPVRDIVLERAMELFKARKLLLQMPSK
ncbi:MAG: PDZ domain-containing protein [Elusimicrobia bacterium]|nr:PDZ domain-containing protein [Elusimicrobiota bacterium]